MINLSAIAFALDRDSPEPLFVQLGELIRERIARAERGSRLPPSRVLAAELGVSRSTVVTAYDQLAAEGYIEGRRGAGFYLRESAPFAPASTGSKPGRDETRRPLADSSAFSHPGYPDPRLFPYRQWARTLARTARIAPATMISVRGRFGDPGLRRSIARYLADWRGLEVEPEQVLITAGSLDGLETCLRTLASPGQVLGLENPGYQPLRHIAENLGMRPCWLPVDGDGARLPPAGQPAPALVVLTPSQQFPLGGTMPVARRHDYLRWARDHGAWIVEDDYDSEFRYAGRPIPAMTSLDRAGRSLYIGTFSKVFSVSLRLGYLVMPPQLVDRFEHTLTRFGVKAALPCQPALADFIDGGDFYRHIRRVRRLYSERRRVLLEGLRERLGARLRFVDHQAGMHIAARLAPGLDDRRIAALSESRGAPVTPLSIYYGDGRPEPGLLLGFCPHTPEEIRARLDILAGVLESGTNQVSR